VSKEHPFEGFGSGEILKVFNHYSGRPPIAKFESRQVGINRAVAAIAKAGVSEDDALVAVGLREAPAPKPVKAEGAPKAPAGKRAAALEAANRGVLPEPPDFSANTHKPYRKRLETLVELVQASDIAGLEAIDMLPPRSSSPKALMRYRDAALAALKAQQASA